MGKFAVDVGGAKYEVEAPDETTAWKWANATHLQAIKNDPQQDAPQVPAAPALNGVDVSSAGIVGTPLVQDRQKVINLGEVPYNVGAKVNDFASQYVPAPFAAGLGAATNAGLEGAQMLAGGGIGGAAGVGAKEAAQGTGKWLMGKAIRPSQADRLTGKFERARDTMLEMGYSPTIGGTDAMALRAAKNDAAVKALIAPSTQSVNKYSVADRLVPVLDAAETSPLPRSGSKTVQDAWSEFLSHPKLQGSSDIPVQLAQEMKQRAYKEMGDAAYGLGLKPAAERDSLKALARGLKEEIEGAVPAVAPINAETSALLNAKKVAQRRAFTEANNNPVSLGTTIAAASQNPLLALGMWANSSSAAKAALARALYTGGKGAPYLGAATGAGGAYLMNEEPK